jgi:hypothetical protein
MPHFFNAHSPWLRLLAVLATSVYIAPIASGQPRNDEGFEPLFPRDDLHGWTVRRWDDVSQLADDDRGWSIKGGELRGGEPRGTWLLSTKEYANFELEFEFKLGQRGNSGLALRAPARGDPAFDGVELQMADVRYNPDAKDSELTGGIYRAIPPRKQVYRPEKWNRYELTVRGSRLRVMLNGMLIHDLDLSQQSQSVKRHDGTDAPPVKDRPRRGHIGFQNLSRGNDPVLIRNARIKVLR